MTVRLYKLGRVLLPIEIRRKLGIEPGSKLEVELNGDGVTLTPLQAEGGLVRRRGVLVWTGPVWKGHDPIKVDRDARDHRNR